MSNRKTNLANFFKNKNIFITGHTGFKGSWLCFWLKKLGANLTGLSLHPVANETSLFENLNLQAEMNSYYGDVCDLELVKNIVNHVKPDIIIHMAAQALVVKSYEEPIKTFATNVLGTAHVLEAARHCAKTQALLVITSDKCYQNNEWHWGYRESDTLGGKDPYSASKACAELVCSSYRESFLKAENALHLATARGGNVLGGGDWSENRLIPDIVRAIHRNQPIILRNPNAIRPWQHVLDLLYGYLVLTFNLFHSKSFEGAWNFGPVDNGISVETLSHKFITRWHAMKPEIKIIPTEVPESQHLKLDPSKARSLLKWQPILDIDQTLMLTSEWYDSFYNRGLASATQVTHKQIDNYWNCLT